MRALGHAGDPALVHVAARQLARSGRFQGLGLVLHDAHVRSTELLHQPAVLIVATQEPVVDDDVLREASRSAERDVLRRATQSVNFL